MARAWSEYALERAWANFCVVLLCLHSHSRAVLVSLGVHDATHDNAKVATRSRRCTFTTIEL